MFWSSRQRFSFVVAVLLCVFAPNTFSQTESGNTTAVCSTPTFYPLRNYYFEDTPSPGFMDVGDLNNDHLPDIMTGQPTTGGGTTMTVMLGTGTFGGFHQEMNVPVGGAPKAITTGDINNDGFVDIINTQMGVVEIYFGDGTGASAAPQYYYPAPGISRFLAKTIAKDLNGDGKLDLIISDDGNANVYVRFGNGDGTFNQTQTILSAGAAIYGEDINNDGIIDLIAPGGIDYASHIFLGQTDGTFGAMRTGTNIPLFDVQFIDLNNDGFKDIIVASTSVYILYNDHVGGFTPAIATPLAIPSGVYVHSGHLADFDGDGILDVAVLTNFPGFRIFKGTSLTSFQPSQYFDLPDTAYDLHVADFNNDGMPDVAFVGYNMHAAYTLINKCGDNRPTFSISGYFANTEGYSINGAGVNLESVESGVLSAFGGTSQPFIFNDLPAGGNYKLTPTHPLFTFVPPSIQVNNLIGNTTVEFLGGIRHFKVYGDVRDYSNYTTPATDVLMRLVGPFSGLTGMPDINSPQMDVLVRTDAAGKYLFKDVLPISYNQFYQIQFPADPIWHGITPVMAIRGLSADQYRGFYAGRNVYSFGVHLTMPNGLPKAGELFFEVEQTTFDHHFFYTDANGMGSLNHLSAGLFHSVYNSTPSLRFSPDRPAAPFLSEDTIVETHVSLRNLTDFDNDGKSDLAVWRPSAGTWYIQNSTNDSLSAYGFGLPTDIPVPADFDGDQRSDIAVFRPSIGNWYIYTTSNNVFSSFHFGNDGDIPIPGDFDRDGKADYTVFRPSNGTWYTFQSYYRIMTVTQFGQTGDRPIVGDFDGDSYNDIAVFRPSNGVWYLLRSTAGFAAVQFGLSTDRSLTGDFDGDTKNDICVWRGETGVWYYLKSSDGSLGAVQFGMQGDLPLSGDFDGDGMTDIAVFRPANGIWYGLGSSNNAFWAAGFGLSNDIPISSMRVR